MRKIARTAPRCAALAVLVLAVYGQVGGHAFLDYDDKLYVWGNPRVLGGLGADGLSWAFTTFHAANWHPLTWLSHMADVTLFGPSPAWHHRVNLLFHLLDTELLFLVLWRMTGAPWPSAFAAALFGVHPLHVESVAWIAERKDLLSALFWILATAAYVRYARRPSVGRYALVAGLFAAGLSSKPMVVTLPFALLLLDFWPLGRMAPAPPGGAPSWRALSPALLRLAREKAPLFALSAASCLVTFLAQARGGAVSPLANIAFGSRLSNALVSYAAYLGQTAWPSQLAAVYPHPATTGVPVPAWEAAGALLLLGGITALVVWQAARRPFLPVGWFWYLGTLVPVIGLVQVGAAARADRYTYIPLVGLFVAVAWWGGAQRPGRRLPRPVLGALGGVAIAALSVAAWNQAGYWRDSVTLFRHAAAVTENNWYALYNLGTAYDKAGMIGQAVACYREGVRINPDDFTAWNNLGADYEELGAFEEAAASYRQALRANPGYADAWYNLGVLRGKLGQLPEAIAAYREALRVAPGDSGAWSALGAAYLRAGQAEQAAACYREARRLRPR